jgi:hypothetical protein
MIENEVKRADMSISQDTYYGFWIGGYYSENITSINDTYEGPALRILKPNAEKRVFKLQKLVGGNFIDIGSGQCDPNASPSGNCVLMMIDADSNGVIIRSSPLSSPDVDVTSLTFRGYHATSPNPPKQPYVTIQMTIKSRWQEKAMEKETANLKTTVSPSSYYAFSIPLLGSTQELKAVSDVEILSCSTGYVAVGAGHWKSDNSNAYPWLKCAQLINGPSIDYLDYQEYRSRGENGCEKKISGNYVVIAEGHYSDDGDEEYSYVRWAKLVGASINYSLTEVKEAPPRQEAGYLSCSSGYVMIGDGHSNSVEGYASQWIMCAKIIGPTWSYE